MSPQVVADWLHSTCWQSVAFRLTGLSVKVIPQELATRIND
ncbi:hypothetical protein ECP03022936_4962 [Escherichia coli P0302293.6]|nr:hypothetical protein ECP03022936_4962 [Escherichia coli P0302293.6]